MDRQTQAGRTGRHFFNELSAPARARLVDFATYFMAEITYREALRQALAEEIERDPNVVVLGEEVAEYNGAYKVTEGLWKKFGDKRVVDTPISEAAFIGMGVGASMLGLRPVMELMFWSFASVAWDQIVNNAGFVRYMSGGLINCPIVIRGPANGGTNVGATHSHAFENMLAHIPGLKVVVPGDGLRCEGAAEDRHPRQRPGHVPGEHRALRRKVGSAGGGVPHPARRGRREARGQRHLASSRMAAPCSPRLQAAEMLAAEHDIQAEVLDLRSIRPLDEEAIYRTVRKTHRALLVEESKAVLRRRRADRLHDPGALLRRSRRARAPHHRDRRAGHLQPEAGGAAIAAADRCGDPGARDAEVTRRGAAGGEESRRRAWPSAICCARFSLANRRAWARL